MRDTVLEINKVAGKYSVPAKEIVLAGQGVVSCLTARFHVPGARKNRS